MQIDDGDAEDMSRLDDAWAATVRIDRPGLHRIEARCGDATDQIDLPPIALGHACHAIGAWPAAGIAGTRLGPNRNGGKA